jgi:flagellar biogenesis protein FliO
MNLFSLMFALLLALAFVVLLMLFFEIMQRDRKPMPAPWKPTHATGTLPVAPSRFG